ncbi:MAG: EAL domain-containing protein [Gammaproteobacteria bacterium]|nr:EAL domain-containing protein [Gammaproteobacteria bacterium]
MSIIMLVTVVSVILLSLAGFIFLLFNKIRQQQQQLQRQLQSQAEAYSSQEVEIMRLKQEIVEKSLIDPLTELPDRQVFEDRLALTLLQSERYQQIFCIMSMDIDHFHIINEALSLEAGDQILRAVAKRLQESIRQIDTVSRIGGNEFLFLFPQIMKPETAGYIARRVLDDFARPFYIDEQEIYLTASLGIAVFPLDGKDVTTLIRNANSALRQAKTQGRNNYQFYRPEIQALSKRDLILDASLRQESVCQEFILYYQPEVHADTHRITCMVTLPYWQHPEFGLLPFNDFSQLAEFSGRINAIGEWLIRMACQQLVIWREHKFFPSAISVPLSLKQLENPHFVHTVAAMLQEYRLDPESLIFAITNTIFNTKIERIEKMLSMLKHLGTRLSINSFGTGSLSLHYLRRLSVDIFRIDPSLVKEMLKSHESESIVRMVVALANSLNATAVAEGVENLDQRNLLLSMNCKMMQGPLFGKPMTAQEVTTKTMQEIAEKA